MRYKSLPLSVRNGTLPEPPVTRAPRPRSRLKDIAATIPILLLVPALMLPFMPALAGTPTLRIDGITYPGARVRVVGTRFTAGEIVKLRWDGVGKHTPSVVVNRHGRFRVWMRIPRTAELGEHRLTAITRRAADPTSARQVVVLARLDVKVRRKPKPSTSVPVAPSPAPSQPGEPVVGAAPSSAPEVVVGAGRPGGLWLTEAELKALPTSGTAWSRLQAQADSGAGAAVDISCQDSSHGMKTMAIALTAARLNSAAYKAKVRDAIAAVIGTESGDDCGHGARNRILGVARNLGSYVIAADLIGLGGVDATLDAKFRSWISALRTKAPTTSYPELTLAMLDRTDGGNWAGYAGASRVAASLYLGDDTDVARSATALKEWSSTGSGFVYRSSWDMSWAANPSLPTPVNPPGTTRDGHSIDGIITVDMRRGAGYQWPPVYTQYPRESIVGRTIQAELLQRAGYDAYAWGSRALLRAAKRLVALDGLDSRWYEPNINAYWLLRDQFGELSVSGSSTGRMVVGVDWSHN